MAPPRLYSRRNIGLLFFNDRPHEFFPATQIDVVWFPDGPGGDQFEEKEFRGPLAAILRDAVGYIEGRYLTEMVVKHPDRPEAERFWNFPAAAIEEALGNATYHRSYEEREPVEVRITPEELLVLSYPGADRSIRMEDLQRGRAVSRRYRNRRIGESASSSRNWIWRRAARPECRRSCGRCATTAHRRRVSKPTRIAPGFASGCLRMRDFRVPKVAAANRTPNKTDYKITY